MESGLNLLLESRIFRLCNPVKVYQFGIDIVNDLTFGRCFSKEDCTSATEGFSVEFMVWDKREDVLELGVLPSVLGYGCFEFRHFRFLF